MTLTNNELFNINGGCFKILEIIRFIRIHIKYITVKFFI